MAWGRPRRLGVAVEHAPALAEGVHNIKSHHGLPLCVLGVGGRVTDNALGEDLHHLARLVVDQGTDPADTTAAGKPTDGALGDALDVIL